MNKISAEEIKRHQAQHQRILDLEQAIKDTAPIFDTKSLNFLTGEDDRVCFEERDTVLCISFI